MHSFTIVIAGLLAGNAVAFVAGGPRKNMLVARAACEGRSVSQEGVDCCENGLNCLNDSKCTRRLSDANQWICCAPGDTSPDCAGQALSSTVSSTSITSITSTLTSATLIPDSMAADMEALVPVSSTTTWSSTSTPLTTSISGSAVSDMEEALAAMMATETAPVVTGTVLPTLTEDLEPEFPTTGSWSMGPSSTTTNPSSSTSSTCTSSTPLMYDDAVNATISTATHDSLPTDYATDQDSYAAQPAGMTDDKDSYGAAQPQPMHPPATDDKDSYTATPATPIVVHAKDSYEAHARPIIVEVSHHEPQPVRKIVVYKTAHPQPAPRVYLRRIKSMLHDATRWVFGGRRGSYHGGHRHGGYYGHH